MKIISVLALFVTLGVFANAQDAKVIAELAASSERAVKNAPFTADAISESVQTLADGNRIVRSSTSKLYRNSEGRFRRESSGGSGGMLGSFYTFGHGVSLFDPIGGYRYMIDPNMKTTRQVMITPRPQVRVVTAPSALKLQEEMRAARAARGQGESTSSVVSDKIREELEIAARAPVIAAQAAPGQVMGDSFSLYSPAKQKWDTRTEELGIQNIEGVDAEGTRTITTIPAGAIGNERPIEITYEKWYSRELQLVVLSKHNDPRFGEQTYRLTNIIRAEPDPSLFTPPQGYRLITEPSSGGYTINVRSEVRDKVRAAPVSKTKP